MVGLSVYVRRNVKKGKGVCLYIVKIKTSGRRVAGCSVDTKRGWGWLVIVRERSSAPSPPPIRSKTHTQRARGNTPIGEHTGTHTSRHALPRPRGRKINPGSVYPKCQDEIIFCEQLAYWFTLVIFTVYMIWYLAFHMHNLCSTGRDLCIFYMLF
jgi:hypothetical protein